MYFQKSAAKLVQTERKNKFYLIFSEVQPNFCSRSELKVVQTKRKNKFQRAKIEKSLFFPY